MAPSSGYIHSCPVVPPPRTLAPGGIEVSLSVSTNTRKPISLPHHVYQGDPVHYCTTQSYITLTLSMGDLWPVIRRRILAGRSYTQRVSPPILTLRSISLLMQWQGSVWNQNIKFLNNIQTRRFRWNTYIYMCIYLLSILYRIIKHLLLLHN